MLRVQLRSTTLLDPMDKNLDIFCFVKVYVLLAFREFLTSKIYVDEAISHSADESSLLRLGPDEKLKLDESHSLLPNSALTSPHMIIGIPAKSYVHS